MDMADLEEGELSTDPEDDVVPTYNPISRPNQAESVGGARVKPSNAMITSAGDMDDAASTVGTFDADSSRSSVATSIMPTSSNASKNLAYAHGADESNSEDDGGLLEESSSDSDSEEEARKLFRGENAPKSQRKKKKLLRLERSGQSRVDDKIGGGSVFNAMAAQFQSNREALGLPTRKKRNNIWGSVLQEESLTSEMTGVGVGRSLKELDSDRGAETYDFVLAQQIEANKRAEVEKSNPQERMKSALDEELSGYWGNKSGDIDIEEAPYDNRKNTAIQAGKKRRVKDRLGLRRHSSDQRNSDRQNNFDDLSIPPPGVPRTIADIDPQYFERSDSDLGKEIAARLSEPKCQLIIGVIEIVGRDVVRELFTKTQQIEADGGMMIKNGERRRTPGGVFLQILRDAAKEDHRINEMEVHSFFAQTNREVQIKRKRRPVAKFGDELSNFKKMSAKHKKRMKENERKEREQEHDMEADEPLKPLPDILTSITEKALNESSPNSTHASSSGSPIGQKPDPYLDLEVPPNSVERPDENAQTSSEIDDFLRQDVDTEDIEIG